MLCVLFNVPKPRMPSPHVLPKSSQLGKATVDLFKDIDWSNRMISYFFLSSFVLYQRKESQLEQYSLFILFTFITTLFTCFFFFFIFIFIIAIIINNNEKDERERVCKGEE